jgi:hypothetical protein
MSISDKSIPTLDEMIFPGRNEESKEPSTKSTDAAAAAAAAAAKPTKTTEPVKSAATTTPPNASASAKPKRNNFETMVNRQVEAILAKHMKAARAEIVRAVMIELRSRLPITNRK